MILCGQGFSFVYFSLLWTANFIILFKFLLLSVVCGSIIIGAVIDYVCINRNKIVL